MTGSRNFASARANGDRAGGTAAHGNDTIIIGATAGSSNTGAAYSFGAALAPERALGGVGSNGFSGYFALALSNLSGQTLSSLPPKRLCRRLSSTS